MRQRAFARGDRPRFTAQDLQAIVEIPLLAALALALPERRWRDAVRAIESLKSRGAWREPRSASAIALDALGARGPLAEPHRFAVSYAAHRIEQYMQGLREELPGGWRANLALEGADHLAGALGSGRGAVVWVAPFAFASLAVKRALAEAGYRAAHVSRPGHGFTTSRFGVAVLNRLRTGAENRWLAERLVIRDGHAGAVLIRAQRVLKANGVVSITAGGWEGQRVATVRLLGRETELAVGAPGIARLGGAALLPVFVVRGPDVGKIRVVVDAPVPVRPDGPRDAALEAAAQAYADRLEPWIRRYPDEWREWLALRSPGAPAPN